jgi:signal transduction histidine kinase
VVGHLSSRDEPLQLSAVRTAEQTSEIRREITTSNTERMLRSATWTMRAVGLVAIGIAIATNDAPDSHIPLEVAALVVACLVMAWWAYTDRTAATRAKFARSLIVSLTLMAIISAVASVTHGGGPLIFLAFFATLAVGAESSIAEGWMVAGLGTLGVECACLALGSSTWTVLDYPLILLVGLLIGRNRRAYRVQAEQAAVLLRSVEELREEQRQVATLDERTRIAREIHDVLAHSLGALGVQIQAARAVLTDQGDIVRTVELLDQAQRLASDGLTETRRAVHALRSDTAPLAAGLAELARTHQQRHSAPVSFRIDGEEHHLAPDVTLALTRVAQEALVNAAKHAAHQPIVVHLNYTTRGVELTIDSTLCPSTEESDTSFASVDGGYGLAGMRERLLLLDGSLDSGARDGQWIVKAEVPR